MFDNYVCLSGTCTWAKARKAKTGNWGTISARLSLPKFHLDIGNGLQAVQNPGMWLSVKASYQPDGTLDTRCQTLTDGLTGGCYLCIRSGRITSYEITPRDEAGQYITGAPKETRYKLECSARDILLAERPFPDVNLAVIQGTVLEAQASGELLLNVPYKSTRASGVRQVPIVTNPSTIDWRVKGAQALVLGTVCGKKPDGEEEIYVYGKTVIPIL